MFSGAEGAALLLDSDEAQGGRLNLPPLLRRRPRGKPWSGDWAKTEAVSASDVVSFAVIAENMSNPHLRHNRFYEKHVFASFGNSSISHTEKTWQIGPGAFTQNNDTRGVYCESGAFVAFCY